jgi:hypothetical protein
MRSVLRLTGGLLLPLALVTTPFAQAQDDATDSGATLERAAELYDQQEYRAAQTALLQMEADELSDADQEARRQLLRIVGDAIQGSERAAQALEAGDQAFTEGEWQEANENYAAVLDNPYAQAEQKRAARQRVQQIEEKQTLAAAARPDGPVEQQEPGAAESASDATAEGNLPTENPLAVTPSETAPRERRATIVDELRQRDELFWQRAVARADEFMVRAREAAQNNNYDEALRFADAALQTIEANRIYAYPETRYKRALLGVQSLREMLINEQDEAQRTQAAAQRAEIAERIERRRAAAEQRREAQIEQLFQEVLVLNAQGQYREAAEVAENVLRIDANNARAKFYLDMLRNRYNIAEQQEEESDRAWARVGALRAADEAKLGTDYPIVYPDNWPEIVAKRGGDQPDPQLARAALDRRLEEVVSEISIPEATFEGVIEFLRDRFDIPLEAAWRQLEDVDVGRDTFVDPFTLRSVTIRQVLDELLLRISPFERLGIDFLPGRLIIRPYDQLSVYPMTYNLAPLFFYEDERDGGGQQQFGGGGIGGGSNIQFSTTEGQDQDREEFIEQLEDYIEIIRIVVGPDNWPIEALTLPIPETFLMVTQTYENHKKIAEFIRTSAGPWAGPGGGGKLQAAYEGRFLTVTHNFLEEIGVDLDFVFNAGNAGYDRLVGADGSAFVDPFTGANILTPRPFSRAGVFPAAPGGVGTQFAPQGAPFQPFGQAAFVPPGGGGNNITPIPVGQNSVALVNPSNLATGVPGSFSEITSPAFSIAGSFLDNLQIDFLIRATKASRRSSIVQAPRVMVANGRSGELFIGATTTFISALNAVPDSNIPEVETEEISSGTNLVIWRSIISPNMRYVTADIQFQILGVPELDRFEVARGGGLGTPSLFITLPRQTEEGVVSTVSIPDGGTVMLGGLKQVGEVEVDAGVPMLSDIPILKRAFTNTGKNEDTQTLLILLKANIVIPQEAEQEAFAPIESARSF